MSIDSAVNDLIQEMERDLAKLSGESISEEEPSKSEKEPSNPVNSVPSKGAFRRGTLLKCNSNGDYYIVVACGELGYQISRITGTPGNRWSSPKTEQELYQQYNKLFTVVDGDYRHGKMSDKVREAIDKLYSK